MKHPPLFGIWYRPYFSIELLTRHITTAHQYAVFVASLRIEDPEATNLLISIKLNKITPAEAALAIFHRRFGDTPEGWLYQNVL